MGSLKVKWIKKLKYFLLSLYLHQTLKRNILSEIWAKIFFIIKLRGLQILRPAAAQCLLNFAHFLPLPHVPHYPASGKSKQIVYEGWCQKWSRLLASNDLNWRREFSHAPQIRHRHGMYTKVVDHNGRIKFELMTINPCHLPTAHIVPAKNDGWKQLM